MIKKVFKFLLKLGLGIILLAVIAYFSFLGWEYITGGKYISYLENHSETKTLEEGFTYEIATEDIEKSRLILVGEIHGSEQPSIFDFDFFKYLHQNHGVRSYFAELDFIQALLMNSYLKSGDEDLLSNILKIWAVSQGRNNHTYSEKYRKFYHYYQSLPENEKFQFIGIDRIQDKGLWIEFLNTLILNPNLPKIHADEADLKLAINKRIDTLSSFYATHSDTLYLLSHLKENIGFIESKKNREVILYENFRKLYKHHQLEDQKAYGYFGLFHVFQYRVNNAEPLAAQIRLSDLGFEDKILSINFLLNDSYMVMLSKKLPEFLRDEGPYTKMPISADNMLVMYLYGIQDFKRLCPENHKSLIKLNSADSPYAHSNRMNTTIQLLPVTNLFEMNEKGKPYVQYTVFVRNSDWAKPN